MEAHALKYSSLTLTIVVFKSLNSNCPVFIRGV